MLTPRLLIRILSILIAILVLAGIVLGFLLFQAQAGTADHRAEATDSSAADVGTGIDPGATPEETTAEAAPDTPTLTTPATSEAPSPSSPQAPSPTSNTPDAAADAGDPMPVGLSSNGWSDNAATSCGSGESLVFAGRGGGNWVTICSSGGTLNYRGDVFDGVLSAAVDQAASNPGAGYFSVPAAPHTIVINESGLAVRDGSTTVSEAGFSESYLAN